MHISALLTKESTVKAASVFNSCRAYVIIPSEVKCAKCVTYRRSYEIICAINLLTSPDALCIVKLK